MSTGSAALQPTFTGHVNTTQDALILFEACLTGILSHVPRRPHDRERNSLIRSGCVFIYEENASGIKRWTDGVTWSPSRILGNFLVYRELEKPFPPGEKKRAMKKNNRRPTRPGEPYPRPETDGQYSPTLATPSFDDTRPPTEVERSLIGSLVDSYGFKSRGLVKKTMSVTVHGVTHHLVSYYNIEDVLSGVLRTPSQTETLQYIKPRYDLTSKQSFRSPIEEADDLDGARDPNANPNAYAYRSLPVGPPNGPPTGPPPGPPSGPPYGMPSPAGFYPQHNQYHNPQFPYPATTAPGYNMGIPTTASYLTQQQPITHAGYRTDHDTFSTPSSYNRSYEAMASSQASSLPPSMGSLSASLGDRDQPQHQSVYGQGGVPPRHLANPSPAGIDPRSAQPYSRAAYSSGQAQPVDRRSMQPSPSQHAERRDNQQVSQPMYTNTNSRQSYYPMNGASPSLGSHAHYQSGTQMPPWNSSPSSQQPI